MEVDLGGRGGRGDDLLGGVVSLWTSVVSQIQLGSFVHGYVRDSDVMNLE